MEEKNIYRDKLLEAPKTYWLLKPEEKKRICNSCGPRSRFDIIPDTIWFLDITEACNIHDYMYNIASSTIEDKKKADITFLNNMNLLISTNTNKYIKIFKFKIKNPLFTLRRTRALEYYFAVKHFGGPSFWYNKIKYKNNKDKIDYKDRLAKYKY